MGTVEVEVVHSLHKYPSVDHAERLDLQCDPFTLACQ